MTWSDNDGMFVGVVSCECHKEELGVVIVFALVLRENRAKRIRHLEKAQSEAEADNFMCNHPL